MHECKLNFDCICRACVKFNDCEMLDCERCVAEDDATLWCTEFKAVEDTPEVRQMLARVMKKMAGSK